MSIICALCKFTVHSRAGEMIREVYINNYFTINRRFGQVIPPPPQLGG